MSTLRTTSDQNTAGLAVPRVLESSERYTELRPLGTGGSGQVFAARDRVNGRMVALKELTGVSARSMHRIKREFRTLAGLQHRNIVAVYELFASGPSLWYAMELVVGVDVVAYCRTKPIEPSRVADVALQLADALESIHAHNVLHRDLKPSNILVTSDGRVVVLDFGLVKELGDSHDEGVTAERAWVGTPAFMAPEQFDRGKLDPACDWYAVGGVLYECLSGQPAFHHTAVEALLAAKRVPDFAPLSGPAATPQIAGLIAGLLDPSPSRRFGAAQLRRVFAGGDHPVPLTSLGSALAGRESELRTLLGRERQVVPSRRAQVVGLSAEPGVGRTRLAEALRFELRHERLAVVALARAHAIEKLPLRALDGLLDDLLAHSRGAGGLDVSLCHPRHAEAMVALFPSTAVAFAVGPSTQSRLAWATRERALAAVADMLARASVQTPLVLIVDDVHCCDADDLDALLGLALALSETPVMIVMTHAAGPGFEAAGVGVDRVLAACSAYLGESQVTRIVLEDLNLAQLGSIAAEHLSRWTGPASAVEAICVAARGNPRLCRWYARELARTGPSLADTQDAAVAAVLLERALSVLSESARSVLTLLALAEGSLPRAVLADLFGGSDQLGATLLELEHAQLLLRGQYAGPDMVSRWHAGVDEHVSRALTPAQASSMHCRLATSLEAAGLEHADRAERHWRLAGESQRAVESLSRACAHARAQQLHHRAVGLLRRAVAVVEAPQRRTELEIELVDSLGRLGRHREAGELARALCQRNTLDPSRLVRLRAAAIGHFAALARPDQVVRLLEGQQGLAEVAPRALLARLVALRLRMSADPPWRWRPTPSRVPSAQDERQLELLWGAGSRLLHVAPESAAYWLGQHLRLAFRVGAQWHQAVALAYEAVMSTGSGQPRLTRASALLSLAECAAARTGDPRCVAVVHFGAGFMWGNLGRFREAISEGRRCIAVLESLPASDAFELGHARVELGWRLLMVGEMREILATVAGRIREAIECEDPVLATALYVQSANANLAADRPDEAARCLDEAARLCPAQYEVGRLGVWLARVAFDLYEDSPHRALANIARAHDELDRLRIVSLPAVRAVYDYRLGVLITQVIARSAGPNRALEDELTRRCRKLGGDSLDVCTAHARLLEASIAARRGLHQDAAGLLREAAVRFAALDWHGMALLTERAYREFCGLAREPSIDARLQQLGVARPARWSATLLPALPRMPSPA